MSFKLAFQAFFFGIVFTLVAIVVIFFKVLEKVEKKYAIRRAAYELRRPMHLTRTRAALRVSSSFSGSRSRIRSSSTMLRGARRD